MKIREGFCKATNMNIPHVDVEMLQDFLSPNFVSSEIRGTKNQRSQDIKEPPKPSTAFRRASAALLKLLPPNNETNQPQSPSSGSSRNENMGKLLSTLYCKLLVLVGLVFPLAEVLVKNGPDRELSDVLQGYYLGYYIFLCTGSLLYLIWMYASMVKDRTVINIINSYRGDNEAYNTLRRRFRGPINRYGSFYLRLGAIAFGIGSMVYSGLEFGRGIERYTVDCGNITQVLSPTFRLMLTIAQMQFIFLNNQNMDLCNKPTLSRFGLMHLIATNLCEWLNVIIQESKHDIELIEETEMAHGNGNATINATHECEGAPLMGPLINDVSPFLFPCTIEYSLICAVIMLDMWMDVKTLSNTELHPNMVHITKGLQSQPSHIFTVDCANAHKGLLCGLVTLVLTIICQILYFVFKAHNVEAAQLSINVCEMALHTVTFMAIILASLKLRSASTSSSSVSYNMDSCLILLAQLGVSLYSVFRLIGLILIKQYDGGILIETGSLVQSISQTVFIVHGRSIIVNSRDSRPARQLITFLLPCNIALWTIYTLIRNRATSDPLLSRLFNPWAWTTVTRIAMPLAIFYRFHSTICLFEMWKNAYKRTHSAKEHNIQD